MGASQPLVRFDGVSKRFGAVVAVEHVDLDIAAGEFFALLGPSGCGKTTLLRMLAGFEPPSSGRIVLDGADITDVPPHRRPVNMMFQSYALFPHLSVADNIAFGLKQEGMAKDARRARVDEMLALVRLQGLGERRPDQLSGGQRQRVALARALAKRPGVLLLDEPLSALDRQLREQTRAELKALQRKLGTTFVIVTHDQDEAMMLADRIGVMNAGRLEQVGTPVDIYERPVSRWVARFIGDVNLIDGTAVGENEVACPGLGRVNTAGVVLAAGQAVSVAVRPENIAISARTTGSSGASTANEFDGRVAAVVYRGDVSLATVELAPGIHLKSAQIGRCQFGEGAIVRVSFAPQSVVVLER